MTLVFGWSNGYTPIQSCFKDGCCGGYQFSSFQAINWHSGLGLSVSWRVPGLRNWYASCASRSHASGLDARIHWYASACDLIFGITVSEPICRCSSVTAQNRIVSMSADISFIHIPLSGHRHPHIVQQSLLLCRTCRFVGMIRSSSVSGMEHTL